jgi:predicted DNA-binding WGR domain protein
MFEPVLRFESRTESPTERSTRYYLIAAGTDLFGAPTLWRAWGGHGSRRGGSRLERLPDDAALAAALARQIRRRERRGYRAI